MKRMSLTVAAGLAAALAMSSITPAQAFQVAPPAVERQAPIELAQADVRIKVWRGHRGYRAQRPGFRRHTDGFWYPPAAFVVKVRPGGQRWSNRHVRWCRSQYVSYRARDNSWKPVNGPRRQCRSPYR